MNFWSLTIVGMILAITLLMVSIGLGVSDCCSKLFFIGIPIAIILEIFFGVLMVYGNQQVEGV